MTHAPPAILLLGPTASGKTACSLALASALPVEIVSVDSALVYRDMDIGTAKPTAEERALCPHHLIDILSPEERYSAAQFRADALRLMDEISARGNIPLLAGGTSLYFKALRDGISDLPQADPELRAAIDRDAERLGWPALHARLASIDPQAAGALEPTDAQRIQRALEIVELTGRPLAESYARREEGHIRHRMLTLALTPSDRTALHRRIEQRFDAMLAAGLLDELRALRSKYHLDPTLPSMRCVGYRQASTHLDGEDDFATMRFKGIAATRQLAKRQLTWQRQFRENWADLEEMDCLDTALAQQVVDRARRFIGA
ncbi:MAG: tRNA (adenosine(37)-N6)-dimethylallyltransferase MiaA [Zoogloeaceae bacterium]|nr:tRNA (adenosine(37)-N6)-dimethylallyltransferase MiaA [Zoogloeaceae bacterium]